MIYPGNMRSQSDQKKAHALRMNVTEYDERTYREPKPLTEEQREKLEAEYIEMRKRMELKYREYPTKYEGEMRGGMLETY